MPVNPPDPDHFDSDSLKLKLQDDTRRAVSSAVFSSNGLSAQYVVVPPGSEYGFEWAGKSHYLGFHDFQMRDGETFADGLPVARVRDARATFTFIPSGCRVWGWTSQTQAHNSFVAIYFQPEVLLQELGARVNEEILQPELFFSAPELHSTLLKLRHVLPSEDELDALYTESVCLLAAVEYCRYRESRLGEASGPGRVGHGTIARVDEFIRENLGGHISLDQLASLTGLSRFHFLRAFKKATGETPYQRVMRMRIERAVELLDSGRLSVTETACLVGFKHPSRFIEAFRRLIGVTPGAHVAGVTGNRPGPDMDNGSTPPRQD